MALKSGRVGVHPSQVDPITGMLLVSPSGASDLADLHDVDIQDPAAGQILVYDGDKWANEYSSISPTTPSKLTSLQDVDITNAQNTQILRYNSSAEKWENENMPEIPAAQVNSDWNAVSGVAQILNKPTIPDDLNDLTDVSIDSPADGEYLVYDSTEGKWINSGEAPAPSYIDKTITIYSAVEDLISFTDAAGITHTEQLATDQSSKQITFKINPTGDTPITFTSSIAKDPDNLSNYYSKTVNISSGTTSVYLMPNDNVLYWYGYQSSNCEDMTSVNGWSFSNNTPIAPTHNKNSIRIACNSSLQLCGVASSNKLASGTKLNLIAKGISLNSGSGYGVYGSISSKAMADITQNYVDTNTDKHYEYTTTAETYLYSAIWYTTAWSFDLSAMWYE